MAVCVWLCVRGVSMGSTFCGGESLVMVMVMVMMMMMMMMIVVVVPTLLLLPQYINYMGTQEQDHQQRVKARKAAQDAEAKRRKQAVATRRKLNLKTVTSTIKLLESMVRACG